MFKDTSLVSVLGLEDLMRKADIAGQATSRPFGFFLAAAAIYFGFLAASTPGLRALERRAARGFSGS